MMETKDWISMLVGAILFCLGLLPMLAAQKVGPSWFSLSFLPTVIFTWIVAIAGLYLLVESFIEITNSNVIGWWSFFLAAAMLVIGILPIIHTFGYGPSWFVFPWLNEVIYRVIFMIEGLFLIIAGFAMEL